jgi:hypothetical protein
MTGRLLDCPLHQLGRERFLESGHGLFRRDSWRPPCFFGSGLGAFYELEEL